jgi:hypothetical protein
MSTWALTRLEPPPLDITFAPPLAVELPSVLMIIMPPLAGLAAKANISATVSPTIEVDDFMTLSSFRTDVGLFRENQAQYPVAGTACM